MEKNRKDKKEEAKRPGNARETWEREGAPKAFGDRNTDRLQARPPEGVPLGDPDRIDHARSLSPAGTP